MSDDVRQRMVHSAAILLARGGYGATSFRDVIAHSGAPRGSIYHYFPHGKDQLVAAALDIVGDRAMDAVTRLKGSTAAEIVDAYLGVWRSVLHQTDCTTGCAVLGVTVSAGNPELISRAAGIFRSWRGVLATRLAEAGVADADGFATLLIASAEGAVVLARSERNPAPLDAVAGWLRDAAERATSPAPRSAPEGSSRARGRAGTHRSAAAP